MYTFNQILDEIKAATGRRGSEDEIVFKRNILHASKRFKSVMRRPWSRLAKKTDTVANQSDYQLPQSVQRVMGVSYKYGDSYFPLIEVGSEKNWERLNAIPSVTIGIPRFFYPKGKNVISLYPTPGEAVEEGIKIWYEERQGQIFADDFTTGTVSATNGSAIITHSGTSFTPQFVGRYFNLTDGSDENWYEIVEYTNSSTLVLENYYEGITEPTAEFLIGYVPNIPEEYHDAIIDYVVWRFYMRRDKDKAADYLASFNMALNECKELYSSPTGDDEITNLQNVSMNLFDIPPNILT